MQNHFLNQQSIFDEMIYSFKIDRYEILTSQENRRFLKLVFYLFNENENFEQDQLFELYEDDTVHDSFFQFIDQFLQFGEVNDEVYVEDLIGEKGTCYIKRNKFNHYAKIILTSWGEIKMHLYLNDFVLEELHVKNNHNIPKYKIGNCHQLFVLSQLVTATHEIKNVSSTNLLKLFLTDEIFMQIDVSNVPLCNRDDISVLTDELQGAVQFSKAIQTGFLYGNEKKTPTFNANLFAKYFLRRVKTVADEHGLLFTYSSEGVYRLLSDVEMGQLIRTLMSDGLSNS